MSSVYSRLSEERKKLQAEGLAPHSGLQLVINCLRKIPVSS